MPHGSRLEEPVSKLTVESGPISPSAPRRPLIQFWQRIFAVPLRRIEEETQAYLASNQARRPDWKVMTVLVTVAICLTLQKYLSVPAILGPLLKLLATAAPLELL